MYKDVKYLEHIFSEFQYISSNISSQEISSVEFLKDETLQRAVVRSLEIIGEATKNVSSELKERNDHINWKTMAGMRDRLIHGYMSVDYELVWEVSNKNIPQLKIKLEKLISRVKQGL